MKIQEVYNYQIQIYLKYNLKEICKNHVTKAYDDRYYNLNKEEYLYETKTNKSNI